uniref:Beta-ketoacyl synthase, C-terminal domain n=1 Tax=Candidatus Kentrum sp. TUN TaxID=2126343 RepID=A0A450ZCR8_9GAMM|nr:MAG: Beta-ketoacyl synthase, C-terminal domain [Candidatus Kentron sp. TUN]
MSDDTALDVAIIGMAVRLPGARNHQEFWSNLRNKVESIRFLEDHEIVKDFYLLRDPNYVKAVAYLPDYDKFDPDFFDIPRNLAPLMTPEHRLFIEASWAAVEDAGYNVDTIDSDVGVYGTCNPESIARYKLPPDWISAGQEVIDLSYGWCPDAIAPNVLRYLGLTGEALSVTTFCTGIHYGIHLACQSLLLGQCDMAIAGGAVVRVPHERGYLWEPAGVFSRDGRCRPYDKNGTGAALGSGAVSFVLKHLEDAVADDDHIYAVIKGTAVNNNGRSTLPYGVPQPERLGACISSAMALAGVEPETISSVAGFGVGHPISDAVEVRALEMAFQTRERGYCSLGSVKGNIGNCGVAAGGASIVKAALSLLHRTIPATINHETPNPDINFPATPFYVNTEEQEYDEPGCGIRRAGVTQIAGAGYNAHLILEEPPKRAVISSSSDPQLVPLSARTPGALARMRANLAAYLEARPDIELPDVGFTLARGRKAFEYRWATVARDHASLLDALRKDDSSVRSGQLSSLAAAPTDGYDRGVLNETPDGMTVSGPVTRETLAAVRDAWVAGHPVDWGSVFRDGGGRRISLPTYAFERERHWLDAGVAF